MSVTSTGGRRPVSSPTLAGQAQSAAKAKLPTVKQLKNVLGTWEFHSPNHQLKWSPKKPAGAVLKEILVEKAPPAPRTGSSVTAYVLKSDPSKVYFRKAGSMAPHYFGPVSWQALPKSMPPHV